MAGGMRKGRGGIPMNQRVRGDDLAEAPPGEARHCWVLDGADHSGVKRAGLLLEWRRSAVGGGWEGRVVYCAALRATGWASVEEWVPAQLLEPA